MVHGAADWDMVGYDAAGHDAGLGVAHDAACEFAAALAGWVDPLGHLPESAVKDMAAAETGKEGVAALVVPWETVVVVDDSLVMGAVAVPLVMRPSVKEVMVVEFQVLVLEMSS